MLGLVRRKEDDDGFFRAQDHVMTQHDQVGTKPFELRRNPSAFDSAIKVTIEVRGLCGFGLMVERYNIIRIHAMYGGHRT